MSNDEPNKSADDGVLDEALAALREKKDGVSANAAATRRAILSRSATTARRRRMLVVRLVLPLAAVLAASTAWAAATGRLPKVMVAIAEVFRSTPERTSNVEPTPPPSSPPPAHVVALVDAGAPTTSVVEDNDASVTLSVITPDASVVALAPTTPTPAPSSKVASTTAPTNTAAAVAAAADPEEALYRTAHEAHFTQRDWSKALTGWDAYLAGHPKGRFAPEARYNRALTLVRLGRRDEARAALTPFADGVAFGGYRQKEAKALLDAME